MLKHPILITSKARVYMNDVLDYWLSEFEDATTDITNDRTLETPDAMLEAVDCMKDQFRELTNLKEELRKYDSVC